MRAWLRLDAGLGGDLYTLVDRNEVAAYDIAERAADTTGIVKVTAMLKNGGMVVGWTTEAGLQ